MRPMSRAEMFPADECRREAPSISQVENDPVRPGRSEPEIHTKDAAETSVERIRARKGGRDRKSYIRLSTASDTAPKYIHLRKTGLPVRRLYSQHRQPAKRTQTSQLLCRRSGVKPKQSM